MFTLLIMLAVGLDPVSAQDAPGELEITFEVISSDQRSVLLEVSCSRQARIEVSALLYQRGHEVLGGHKWRSCDGAVLARVVMTPRIKVDRSGRRLPIRRVLRGPAQLNLTIDGTAAGGGFASAGNDSPLQVFVDQPDLARGYHSYQRGQRLTIDPVTLRSDGALVVPIRYLCTRTQQLPRLTVTAFQNAPGATYRQLSTTLTDIDCGVERVEQVELGAYDPFDTLNELFGTPAQTWVLGPGPIEVVAEIDDLRTLASTVAMQPDQIDGDALPELIRPAHDPDSQIRIGRSEAASINASVRCPATVDSVLVGTWAVRRGMTVRQGHGFRIARCRNNSTAAFRVPWSQKPPTERSFGVHIASLGGPLDLLEPSWIYVQGGQRRVQ
ncbi:MAG: hypothetical protein ACR2QE_13625 [Acidimicrobiales bacterium]